MKLSPEGPSEMLIIQTAEASLVTLALHLWEAACKNSWARGRTGAGLQTWSNQQLGLAHCRVEGQLNLDLHSKMPRPGLSKRNFLLCPH